jgi:hypothetical protein
MVLPIIKKKYLAQIPECYGFTLRTCSQNCIYNSHRQDHSLLRIQNERTANLNARQFKTYGIKLMFGLHVLCRNPSDTLQRKEAI